jgi:predicted nucleotidyltransferase
MSLRAVQTALSDLVVEGLVNREVIGRAHQYTFNHEHVVAAAVKEILGARTTVLERISGVVSAWEPVPEAVWLFGSIARGEGSGASDIDLMIIRDDDVDADSDEWVDGVWNLTEKIAEWTGLQCEVLHFSSTEAREGWHQGLAILDDVTAHGLTVWGLSPREWRRQKG